MQPNPRFWAGKRVCVTGGTGFLGWHIVQQLLPLAGHVRILGLPPKSTALAALLGNVDCVFADVRDPGAARRACGDCDVVFHTAGTIAMWGPALEQMRDIHLRGTARILQALPADARLVHTSSVVAIGATIAAEVLHETAPFPLNDLKVDYVHVKKAAEDIALAAAARGQNVVIVNPAYLIGPDDHENSVMGRFCQRCWKGRVPLVPPGGMNFVDVRDAALGHLLAAEHGSAGARYILGGANLTMLEFAQRLADASGHAPRARRAPGWLFGTIAYLKELRARFVRREPYPSMQHARLSRYHWYYSCERAQTELGYQARPLNVTLRDTYDWYCRTGLLQPAAPRIPDHTASRAAA